MRIAGRWLGRLISEGGVIYDRVCITEWHKGGDNDNNEQ